jgi:hypothetical protein
MDLLNSELARFDISSSGRPWYLIYKSDILPNKTISQATNNYIEVDIGYYVYCTGFPSILLNLTGLTAEDYYKKIRIRD